MIVHPVEIVLLGKLKMYLDVTIVESLTRKPDIQLFARGNTERYYGI